MMALPEISSLHPDEFRMLGLGGAKTHDCKACCSQSERPALAIWNLSYINPEQSVICSEQFSVTLCIIAQTHYLQILHCIMDFLKVRR